MGLFNGYHKGKHEEHLQHIDENMKKLCKSMEHLDRRVQRVERIYWLLGACVTILVATAPFGPSILEAIKG